MNIGSIKVSIKLGDITEENTDAIVHTTDNSLLDIDQAIYKKGGNVVLEQCKKHGGCATGEAKITVAGNLNAKYVIHTVAPVSGKHGNLPEKLLYLTYINSLKLAADYCLKSISFPAISTSSDGFPLVVALQLAFQAIKDFSSTESSVLEIKFLLSNQEDYELYEEFLIR